MQSLPPAAALHGIPLRCVYCGSPLLVVSAEALRCREQACARLFPVLDGVPVVLHGERSVFTTTEFVSAPRTTYAGGQPWAKRIASWLPSNSRNVCRAAAFRRLAALLRGTVAPRVLVVGSGDGDLSYREVGQIPGVTIVEADVSLEGRPTLVCDGHDLPFFDNTFDLVVCEAVLEHVVDPRLCVQEIHRVLRANGLVFAATPFMQQVHMGPYDFMRFTRSGHRVLFQRFQEVESGVATGPASVLVWSIEYFLLAWASRLMVRRVIKALTRLSLGWLTLLDHLIAERPSAFDGAGGFYFIGRASPGFLLSPRQAVQYYAGCDDVK